MRRAQWVILVLGFLAQFVPAGAGAQTSDLWAGEGVFPDRGQLTDETAISFENGRLNVAFENKYIGQNRKWQGELGERKKRALIELLIYRKMSVEFLLTARERIRFLGYALRMDEDPNLVAPAHLRNALSSGFSLKDFKDMNRDFIGPALAPITPDAPRFDSAGQNEFLAEMLRQSAQALQIQAQLAHAEETKADAQTDLYQNVPPDEEWRNFCRRSRSEVEAAPLSPDTASTDALRIRAAQNLQIRNLLQAAQGLDSERLLFTPVNFSRRYAELLGDVSRRWILKDLNSIRRHPTSEGILANALMAVALEDLDRHGKFTWRKGNGSQPRSELVCRNWDEIPLDQISFGTRETLRQVFLFGIQEALRTNERALLFLLHLDQNNPVETVLNNKSWMEPEREPKDPDGMVDKFIDLAPLFLKSERLAALVRWRYPDGDPNPEHLKNMLLHVYDVKQKRLEKREKTLAMYGWVTAIAFTVSGRPEWRAGFRYVALLIALSDAVTIALVEWPAYTYRHEMRKLTEALFMGGDGDAPVPIVEKDLWRLAILDHRRANELRISLGILAAANVWLLMPAAFRVMRAWRGTAGAGAQAFEEAKVWAVQTDFMRVMKVIEAKFPTIWNSFERSGRVGFYRRKIQRFMPNAVVKNQFPGIYHKLQLMGLTENMERSAASARIQEISKSTGKTIRMDEKYFWDSYLWKVALDMGWVDDEITAAPYFRNLLRRIDRTGPDFRSSEAGRVLREIEKDLKAVKNERKRAWKTAARRQEMPRPAEEENLKRLIGHVENMNGIQRNLRKELRHVPYDDRDSQSVKRAVAYFERLGKKEPYLQFRALTAGLRTELSKLIPAPVVLRSAVVREFLIQKAEKSGLAGFGRWLDNMWSGRFSVTRLDNRFQRLTVENRVLEKMDLYFDKRTVSKFIHQGMIQGLPITLIGDRAARKFLGGKAFFSWDELDQTAINVTVGMTEQFLKSGFFTGAFTFPMRMRGAMGVTLLSNMILTAPQTVLALRLQGVPWADAMDTFLDPDCILSRTMRMSFGAAFHGTISTLRGRGTFVTRGIFENKKFGGSPDGGMSGDGAGKFFVISLLDKTVLGSFTWTAMTRAIGGTGSCDPIKDPFKDGAGVAWSRKGNGLLEEIEGVTGLRAPTVEDMEAILKTRERGAKSGPERRSVPDPLPPSEIDRIRKDLGTVQQER